MWQNGFVAPGPLEGAGQGPGCADQAIYRVRRSQRMARLGFVSRRGHRTAVVTPVLPIPLPRASATVVADKTDALDNDTATAIDIVVSFFIFE